MARTRPTRAPGWAAADTRVQRRLVQRYAAMFNARYAKAGAPHLMTRFDRHGNVDLAPKAPASLRVTQAAEGATLLWGAASDDHAVRAYRVYRDGKLLATVRNTTWFVDRTNTTGTSHLYEVRAVDSVGGVSRAAATPGPAAPAPAAPTATPTAPAATPSPAPGATPAKAPAALALPRVTAAPIDANSVKLSWPAIPGAQGYAVYQDGQLLGLADSPSFSAAINSATPVALQIEAVNTDGSRSGKTEPLAFKRGAKGVEPVAAQAASGPTFPPAAAPAASPPPQAPATAPATAGG